MPSMIECPSGRTPEKAPRWDLMGTEGYDSGKVFSLMPLMVWECLVIYRPKIRVRGARGTHKAGGLRGVHEVGGRAPTLVVASGLFWPISGTPWASSGPKMISVKFQVNWTPFDFSFLRYSKIRKKQKLALGSRLIG